MLGPNKTSHISGSVYKQCTTYNKPLESNKTSVEQLAAQPECIIHQKPSQQILRIVNTRTLKNVVSSVNRSSSCYQGRNYINKHDVGFQALETRFQSMTNQHIHEDHCLMESMVHW